MDILEKAKELGKMIAASDEMTEFNKAEAAMEIDEKSKVLMNDYKLLQIEVVKATREGRDKSIIESIKDRLVAKQDEINKYKITGDYLVAKANMDNLIKKVNDVMIFAITGEESCNPNKCNSCSGCK
ncbi:MAG: YlbF family regulator [Bacillota bacterium]|nr:YlbF family regulator [Bacillota bacterium]